jgi:hypothetical protein
VSRVLAAERKDFMTLTRGRVRPEVQALPLRRMQDQEEYGISGIFSFKFQKFYFARKKHFYC